MPRQRRSEPAAPDIPPHAAAPTASPIDWMDFIRRIRNQLGESQEVFAERLGVTQTTVSRWETGASLPLPGTQRTLRMLATWSDTTDAAALEGMISSVGNSPFPMLLCDGNAVILAASRSSGFASGRSAETQTPADERGQLRLFLEALQEWRFWDVATRRWAYIYRDSARTPRAVVTRVLLGGRVLALVQRLEAPLSRDVQ